MEVLSSTLTAALGELARARGVIILIDAEQAAPTGGRYRLAIWTDQVSYDRDDGFGAQTYFPIAASLAEDSQEDGTLEDLAFTVSNITRTVTTKLQNKLLRDQIVRVTFVDAANLANAGHGRELIYRITEATATEEVATLMFSTGALMQHVHPKGRFLPNRCDNVYEGGTNPTVNGRCAAVSALETCDKAYSTSTGCAGRNNQARFNGYPHSLREQDMLLG